MMISGKPTAKADNGAGVQGARNGFANRQDFGAAAQLLRDPAEHLNGISSSVRALALAGQERRSLKANVDAYNVHASALTPDELAVILVKPVIGQYNAAEKQAANELLAAEMKKPEFASGLTPDIAEAVKRILSSERRVAKPASARAGGDMHRVSMIDGLAGAQGVWASVWLMLNDVYLATKAEKGAGQEFMQATYKRLSAEFPQLGITNQETSELLGLMKTRRFVQVAVYEDFFGTGGRTLGSADGRKGMKSRLLTANTKVEKARQDIAKDLGTFLRGAGAAEKERLPQMTEGILSIFVNNAIAKARTLRAKAEELGREVRKLKMDGTISGKPTDAEWFAALFVQTPQRNPITELKEFQSLNIMLAELPATLGTKPKSGMVGRALYNANRPFTQEEVARQGPKKSIDSATSSS